jgi:hypothetical protein
MSSRSVVFLSHANPEDNVVVRWLTLKLASLGYRAWSDVTRLFGGEDFWKHIEVEREIVSRSDAKNCMLLSQNGDCSSFDARYIERGIG